MPDRRHRATVTGMLACIDPDWRPCDRRRLRAGHHHTERLTVATSAGRRVCVLKAAPAGESTGLGLECRLLAALGARTTVPVPDAYGVVDAHDDYPTPFALFEAVDRRRVRSTEVGSLDADTRRGVVRSVGRHLAALHDLDTVDAFDTSDHRDATRGAAGRRDPRRCRASRSRRRRDRRRPPGGPTSGWRLAPEAGSTTWPPARRAVADRVAGLAATGPIAPALAHIDCSVDDIVSDVGGTRRRCSTGRSGWRPRRRPIRSSSSGDSPGGSGGRPRRAERPGRGS